MKNDLQLITGAIKSIAIGPHEIKATFRKTNPKDPKENTTPYIVDFNTILYLLDEIDYKYGYTSIKFQHEYSLIFQSRMNRKKDDQYMMAIEKDINNLIIEYCEKKLMFIQEEVQIKHVGIYPYFLPMKIMVINRSMIKGGGNEVR